MALTLDQLRAFALLAETGSFTRAGERLQLSKSVVSRRVAELEALLGAQLVTRNSRAVALTETGRAFQAQITPLLGQLDQAVELVTPQPSGELVGRLRMTAPVAFGMKHVAPLAAELLAQHPRLSLDLDLSDRMIDLVAEGFDLAVRIGTLPDSRLIARRLGGVGSVTVASPGYLAAAGGPPEHPRAIVAYEGCSYANMQPADEWRWKVDGSWISAPPRIRLRSNTSETLIHAALAGLGLIAVPHFLVQEHIEAGCLVQILPGYSMREAGLFLVWPGNRDPGPRVRAVIDALVHRVGEDPGCLAVDAAARQLAR